jgi:hypothetical protein
MFAFREFNMARIQWGGGVTVTPQWHSDTLMPWPSCSANSRTIFTRRRLYRKKWHCNIQLIQHRTLKINRIGLILPVGCNEPARAQTTKWLATTDVTFPTRAVFFCSPKRSGRLRGPVIHPLSGYRCTFLLTTTFGPPRRPSHPLSGHWCTLPWGS